MKRSQIIGVLALVLCAAISAQSAYMNSANINACLSIAEAVPTLKMPLRSAWTQTWLESCDAIGLTCDSNGNVIQWVMPATGSVLTGTFPEALSQLTSLTALNLGATVLTGTLPASWGTLTSLQSVVMASSPTSSSIPDEWSGMTSLNVLSLLFKDSPETVISDWMGTAPLTSVTLNKANLDDFTPLTTSSTIGVLNILAGSLSGTIPDSLWINPTLTQLTISVDPGYDFFASSNTFPTDISAMTSLRALTLAKFAITGSIPVTYPPQLTTLSLTSLPNAGGILSTALLNLDSLTTVSIDSVPITGIAGPTTPANSNLASLSLRSTSIRSPYFARFSKLSSLTIYAQPLDDSYAIPEFGSLSPLLQTLSITNCPDYGSTPPASYASLTQLVSLTLDNNGLTGTIPSAWANFANPNFAYLSMNGNRLSGALPSLSFATTTARPYLSLKNAGITGTIPISLANLSSTVSSAGGYGTFDLSGNTLTLCTTQTENLPSGALDSILGGTCALAQNDRCSCSTVWPSKCFTATCPPVAMPIAPPVAVPVVTPVESPVATPAEAPTAGPIDAPNTPTETPTVPAPTSIFMPTVTPTGAASTISSFVGLSGLLAIVLALATAF